MPIAASRAGAAGLLDLSHLSDASIARRQVERLVRLSRGKYGIVLDGSENEVEAAALDAIGSCDSVVFAANPTPDLSTPIARARRIARRIGVVCTDGRQASAAARLDVDFVVAKGHEAGGRVGDETSFVLVQRLLDALDLPVFAWGGIGRSTAAACRVVGASGVLLDWQLGLTRESPLPGRLKRIIAAMDGSETTALPCGDAGLFRVLDLPGEDVQRRLDSAKRQLGDKAWASLPALNTAIAQLMSPHETSGRLWPVGQDAALASAVSRPGEPVSKVLSRLRSEMERCFTGCVTSRLAAEGAPLAQSHGTTYPIVQGPMTRVSDVPEFCEAVAKAGGLPSLALGVMGREEALSLLRQTSELLGDRPWSVGILGFIDEEVLREQFSAIREVRPPFAIIAGGRPDQAALLEAEGIRSYLHVPSPELLRQFLAEGARRFVFEGRECGGHVGPRTSFVLWESQVRVLLEANLSDEDAALVHVLFAGGIHDGRSAATVCAAAQPLAARNMKVGFLMGSAYLFTREIVRSGALLLSFQEIALESDQTVLVESARGHEIRIARTDYAQEFQAAKRKLEMESRPAGEIRDSLERMNLGRLRVASKGVKRASSTSETEGSFGVPPVEEQLEQVGVSERRRTGMYMMGQTAALRDCVASIASLHDEVCNGAIAHLESLEVLPAEAVLSAGPGREPFDIAIVGMSCLLPGASDLDSYWHNILTCHDAIGEVPPERFDIDRWYDAAGGQGNKTNSRWGGFIDEITFNPLRFGIPPAALKSIEPMQLLALEVVDRALRNAGYADDNPLRDRTSVILGVGGGLADLGGQYLFHAMAPHYMDRPDKALMDQLPEWTEDSFPGILLNIVAGRIANRFNFGGVNYVVDAACASSLAAVYQACGELAHGTSDMVITGGCETVQTPLGYVCFSNTGALSSRGRSRPFDESADGIAISEGVAALVLKRREDAERDGDRIFAIIRGVAGGSDGRSKGLTAPLANGQARVIRRAYEQAGFSPATLGLIEAHGTGTEIGDVTECQAVLSILAADSAGPQSIAIGSVKSMIGHTRGAAGAAGLIKASLALYHRALPPTMHVEKPNSKAGLVDGPLYVNSEVRPWIRGEVPRRAGVSAFGFGGSNFHAVLEEYEGDACQNIAETPGMQQVAELFTFSAQSRDELADQVRSFHRIADERDGEKKRPELADLAIGLHRRHRRASGDHRAAVVVSSLADLREKLALLSGRLPARGEQEGRPLPAGVHLSCSPTVADGKIAFLFPGQGSQHPGMLRDLAVSFSEVRQCFERADGVLAGVLDRSLSSFVFPPPSFDENTRKAAFSALKQTDVAQPALGVCGCAMQRVLSCLGVRPDMVAGHSYGELVALHVAGCYDEETLYRLSSARGRAMAAVGRKPGADAGGMRAVGASEQDVRKALGDCDSVWLANVNAPAQTIISGTGPGLEKARDTLKAAGLATVSVPVACAFHSPLVAPAREELVDVLGQTAFQPPRLPVFSNVTAAEHPADVDGCRHLLAEQLTHRVRFMEQIEAMYEAGARVFIEAGPKSVLSRLVDQILGDRPHLALATQPGKEHGFRELLTALATLHANGIDLELERLFEGRRDTGPEKSEVDTGQESYLWRVDGGHARPASQPRRKTMGPARMKQPDGESTPPRTNEAAAEPVACSGRRHRRPGDRDLEPVANDLPPLAVDHDGLSEDDVAMMAGFQETMRQFLRTQQAVMEAFLGASPHPASARSAQPAETARDETPMVAPVEELAAAAAPIGRGPEQPEALASTESLEEQLTAIVSERTGYPPDMLDPDADLEADLSIDSIKRVEIVGRFRRSILPDLEEPPAWYMERMGEARTLRECIECIRELIASEGGDNTPVETQAAVTGSAPAAEIDLEERLRALISERTGYPPEMLTPDTNLEADLSIDSIKRVEVIGLFRRSVLPSLAEPPSWYMERMGRVTTMREICEGMAELLEQESGLQAVEGPAQANAASASPRIAPEIVSRSLEAALVDECPRCLTEVVECPLDQDDAAAIPEGVVLITRDEHGVADSLAGEVRARGGRAAIIECGDLRDRAAAETAVQAVVREEGDIGAIVHLCALDDAPEFPGIAPEEWNARVRTEIKSLLFLLQAMAPTFGRARHGSTAVLCVSRTGSGSGDSASVHPWRGGLAGLLKTAAREWDEVRFRSLDCDELPTASSLMSELSADGAVEVRREGDRRLATIAVRRELPESAEPVAADAPVGRMQNLDQDILDENDIVLVTGGARGITAQIAHEIALHTKATLVLLGRTPLPRNREDDATASILDPVELRKEIIRRMRGESADAIVPSQVEDRLGRLLRDREVRRTLEAVREAGSHVEYHCCDVRDDAALRSLITRIKDRRGAITALVHGAGVIEDRYIAQKAGESFDRVLGTKLDPVLTLVDILDYSKLKFAMLFSSVAGFYGNPGQCDYAAANEILNHVAMRLRRVWKTRVVALNWGPWHGTGMVTPEVASQFEERGVGMVTVPSGRRAAWTEIVRGNDRDERVILGPGPWVEEMDGGGDKAREPADSLAEETISPFRGSGRG
ncbi:MAG: SDR family NAD(P)-dependent oxidoreductase [Planctomycetota bacterium]